MVSLRPGSGGVSSLPQFPEPEPVVERSDLKQHQGEGEEILVENLQKPSEPADGSKQLEVEEKSLEKEQVCLANGFDMFERPPPKTESEVRTSGVKGWGCGVKPRVSWQKDAVHKVTKSREGFFCRPVPV